MSDQGLAPQYNPEPVEKKWYEFWTHNGLFHAEPNRGKRPYTMVIPPPNITGILHLGHVLNNTVQDVLIRWKRMQGYEALWMPGTDHAGIATQVVVERMLSRQGIDRRTLGREKFVETVWKWRTEYGGTIIRQLKSLGCSCDWERERFTMDEGLSRAVLNVFVALYRKGLIYRGYRIINWCPRCLTALSNEEAIPHDETGHLWVIRYPLQDGSGDISVATTRPETMLGDTGVAVNPDDPRYAHLIGKTVILPLVGREIPIVGDAELVDPSFGTGAVKVTPAHDPNDFIMGDKHDLPQITVMDEHGIMNADAGAAYQGLDRFACRKQVVRDLEELGLLVRVEAHHHAIPRCQRCETVIEPRLSKQWFVRARPLADRLLHALDQGGIPRFTPEHWVKTYRHWLEHIEDWCISRQLWWGHRIPVWYCESCEQEHADFDVPERCSRCGHGKLRQDEDVLDTWFSSALWPFSTMGWPEKTPELAFFYPTSTLVTGHDILFFWVARMMMMGYEFMDDRPFDQVYLTSLVRDVKGRKLSKSLGNSPDPLQVMETYGTDALRFAMILMAPQGQDILYSNERVEVGRNFANKLWNAARFTLMHQSAQTGSSTITESDDIWDRWIRSRSAQTVTRVTGALDRHDFNAAADALYDFVWHDFCDWYLEAIKPRLYGNQGEKAKETARSSALLVLERTLRLLHPFMPFITEEIWQHIRPLLPGEEKPVSVMVAEWPADAESGVDETVESDIALVQNLVGAMREVRADFRVHPSRTMKALCQIHEPRYAELLEQTRPTVESIAGVEIHVMDGKETRPSGSASGILTGIEFYVPLAGLIDTDVEVERLTKERERITGEFEKVKARIASTQFLEKAPAEVVEKEYSKRDRYADLIVRLTRNLETLQT